MISDDFTKCCNCSKIAEYESPKVWCRFCWCAWWIDGIVGEDRSTKEWKKEYKNLLARQRRKYGKYPGFTEV